MVWLLCLLLLGDITVNADELPRRVTELRITGRNLRDDVVYGPLTRPRAAAFVVTGLPEDTNTLRIEGLDGPDLVADYVTTINGTVAMHPAFVDLRSGRTHSFMVLGCNRLNQSDQNLTPSSANTAQLVADFQEIQPSLVLFTGDLVCAQNRSPLLAEQLREWVTMWEHVGQGRLAALPGNHEMLYWDDRLSTEVPDPPTGAVWSDIMRPYIGDDGPKQGTDGLQRDETHLSYTFRRGTSYFVCVNTETWQGGLTEADTGHVPLGWVREKLAQGQADPSIENIFVFGHKPVSVLVTDDPLPTITAAQGAQFYALLNETPKVRAYLCAHAHRWTFRIPISGGRVPQLIAGNAGSIADEAFRPGYYGYTMVHVLESGDITVESWGRPIPSPYSDQAPQPICTVRERFTLYRRGFP